MYVVKINGVRYEVENGVYNPPLPQERIEKDAEHIKDIVKTRQCPGLRTDTNWHAGRGTLMDQMDGDEAWCRHLVREAKEQGYTPGINDVYIGQIADKTGDPDAWIKPGDGRAEIIKRAKKKGKGVEAPGISVKPQAYVEKQGPQLSETATRFFTKEWKKDGRADGLSKQELRQKIKETHGRAI